MKKQVGLSVIVGLLAFCTTSYAQAPFIPGSAESLGLTRIVPDTLVWFSSSQMRPKIGGLVPGDDVSPGSDVEATPSVLGDSTFLLAATTRATNDSTLMSHTSVLIPATGGTPKLDNLFHSDSGVIYLRDINQSRQTGNPGRIAGDPRYGAVNYMGAAEVSLWFYTADFNSDGRWSNPWFDTLGAGGGRSACMQTYALNPLTLVPTMLLKAQDCVFGSLTNNVYPNAGQNQISRTGGTIVGLDNGNFVCVPEDRSGWFTGGPDSTTAKIWGPDGTVIKDAWEVAQQDIWSNVGAYRGGFYVRPAGGNIYFFDNAGNPTGTNAYVTTSGLSHDTGRGDGSRTCSDIRSHYVFMGGIAATNGTNAQVYLSAFDAKTASWIANTIVSEGNSDPLGSGGSRALDPGNGVNVACDAYDRVCVVYKLKPDNSIFLNWQIAVRVFAFDGTKFTPLTDSFYAFIEHDSNTNNVVGFVSQEPSVAMTPRQILIYAEGNWNATASPTDPPVTALTPDTHCYTIISHPRPIAAPRPQMTLTYGSPNSTISWLADAGLFVLQSSTNAAVSASWADVSPQPAITRSAYVNANDKYQMSVPNGTSPKFYRLVRRW